MEYFVEKRNVDPEWVNIDLRKMEKVELSTCTLVRIGRRWNGSWGGWAKPSRCKGTLIAYTPIGGKRQSFEEDFHPSLKPDC